jgi:hypothetical protein
MVRTCFDLYSRFFVFVYIECVLARARTHRPLWARNKPGARNYTFYCTAARSYIFGVDGCSLRMYHRFLQSPIPGCIIHAHTHFLSLSLSRAPSREHCRNRKHTEKKNQAVLEREKERGRARERERERERDSVSKS